ncbi:prepilin peptidase [bacterium]|nr:prepilin peptidase [bacterium]
MSSIEAAQQILEPARHVLLLLLLVVAAYTDVARGKVYNWCTYPCIFAGLAIGYIIGGWNDGAGALPNSLLRAPEVFDLQNSLLGLVAAGGLFGLFFVLGSMGAGDVKMAAAIGALMGWHFAVGAVVFSSLVGGAMAIGWLIWRGQLRRGLWDSLRASVRLKRAQDIVGEDSPATVAMPYGLALSIGTLWAWFIWLGKA